MAASGFTQISLYSSTTASAVPLSANLTNGELAINIADGKLYYKDNLGVVTLLAEKNATSGSFTNLTVSGTFAANGGATLGDAIGDALTINSGAVSVPNGLNFDSNTLVIDATNNRIGVGVASPTVALDVSGTVKATVGDFASLLLSSATLSGALIANGTFAANGGVTLGDAIGDALTINSGAVSTPNGLNFDSNTLVIDAANNRVGVGVAAPTATLDVLGNINTSAASTFFGVSVGRGSGGIASNTAVGFLSVGNNTSGSSNTGVGRYAINQNTTGFNNTALGDSALFSNTTATYNTAIGAFALRYNTTGASNTAIGSGALELNTTGSYGVAHGVDALRSNTSGSSNTAVGHTALSSNTTGQFNSAFGRQAMSGADTGSNNTAIGYATLQNITTGSNNVAVGHAALNAIGLGVSNTAIGFQANFNATTGSYNNSFGMFALQNVTTGSGNTAISPVNAAGVYAPVFNPVTETNRFCMGSTAVTNAYIQVAWTVVSDARDKTDFAPVPHGLDFVNKLKPTAYRYKESRDATEGHGPVRYGFRAQDVLALEGDKPVIVDAEDSEKLRFNDQAMLAVLVNAINDLTEEVNSLKARVKTLEAK